MKIDEVLKTHKRIFWDSVKSEIEDPTKTFAIIEKWSHCADHILKDLYQEVFGTDRIALFALGKLGSTELNISSDIDIVFVCNERSEALQKKVRTFTSFLQSNDHNGFIFRVDYNLRPGGASAPLIPSVDEYCDYYTRLGQTWERIALYRARPIAGDSQVISEILKFNERFIFRKHLDYQIFSDVLELRQRILSEKEVLSSHTSLNLKFAPGGIRDIELFIHSLAVIHGGRNSKLRNQKILELIDSLTDLEIISPSDAETFKKTYHQLRFLENFVQYQDDQQTHSINLNIQSPEVIKNTLQSLLPLLEKAKVIVRALLGKENTGSPLESLTQEFEKMITQDSESQELSKGLFLEFLKSIEAKPSFYQLLLKEKELLSQLAQLFSRSNYLSRILISRPELLDSFIFRRTEIRTDDWETFLEDLVEKRLLTEIISGNDFLETQNLDRLLQSQTSVAEEVAQALLKKLNEEFSVKTDILCLGKWASFELGSSSDLDFIFVTEEDLSLGHHKVAQRFISRITERHRGGVLYSIDLRLKPQSGAGALVVSKDGLKEFLESSPPAWIRLAYLRSRKLGSDLTFEMTDRFKNNRLTENELKELSEMQVQLYQKASSETDLKYSPGGILDIELSYQSAVLMGQLPFEKKQAPLYQALKSCGYDSLGEILYELRVTEQLHLLHGRQPTVSQIQKTRALLSASRNELRSLDPRPRSS